MVFFFSLMYLYFSFYSKLKVMYRLLLLYNPSNYETRKQISSFKTKKCVKFEILLLFLHRIQEHLL